MLAKFYQNYKIAAKCQVPAKGSDGDVDGDSKGHSTS